MILSYLIMPSYPDKISISRDLVVTFRLVSMTPIVKFLVILGEIFGTLQHWFKPHNLEKITAY